MTICHVDSGLPDEFAVRKLKAIIDLVEGERVQLGDRVVCLEAENKTLTAIAEDKVVLNEVCYAQEQEIMWMRREIERVGRALFTGTETGHYVGTEEDLHAVGQFVEGVCENNELLFDVLETAQAEIDGCPFCKRGMECKATHYKLRETLTRFWKGQG